MSAWPGYTFPAGLRTRFVRTILYVRGPEDLRVGLGVDLGVVGWLGGGGGRLWRHTYTSRDGQFIKRRRRHHTLHSPARKRPFNRNSPLTISYVADFLMWFFTEVRRLGVESNVHVSECGFFFWNCIRFIHK